MAKGFFEQLVKNKLFDFSKERKQEMTSLDYWSCCNHISKLCFETDKKWHIGEHSIDCYPETNQLSVFVSTSRANYPNWQNFLNDMTQLAATSGIVFKYRLEILEEDEMMYERLDIYDSGPTHSNRFGHPLGPQYGDPFANGTITFKKTKRSPAILDCCCIL
jgi:hypothetical protein